MMKENYTPWSFAIPPPPLNFQILHKDIRDEARTLLGVLCGRVRTAVQVMLVCFFAARKVGRFFMSELWVSRK